MPNMLTQKLPVDSAFEAPLVPFLFHEAGVPERADALMAWGHAAALGGSLAGIAGGFGLVAYGSFTPLVITLLVTGPVAGMLVSGLLYSAASRADTIEARDRLAKVA